MDSPERKRRPRYSGTHPRRFHEKYKELNPSQYPELIEKIHGQGKTPAGTHRPICLKEVMEVLNPQPGELALDATLGHGGHALELWRAIQPSGKLFALDADPLELPRTETRLRAAGLTAGSFVAKRMNFAGITKLIASEGLDGFHLILADLGVSSMQLDNPDRGFTFKNEGPLDMRMNPNRGQPASELLARLTAAELSGIFRQNSDEPHAEAIAAHLKASADPIRTTSSLAAAIRQALTSSRVPSQEVDLSIRRVFQALRIEVNEEFSALDMFLRQLPDCLLPGGRVAVLTFHSGEDRRVKAAFKEGLRSGGYGQIAEEVIRPSPSEIRSNPRAAPAKLRWAKRS